MYTLTDAVRLKEHVLERWEAADKDPALVDDGALNIVVVGGGPTGVESAGALAELYRGDFASDYPSVPQEQARVILVEAGPEVFSMFKPKLRAYTAKALEERTVEVMTGEIVSRSRRRVSRSSRGRARGAHARLGRRPQGNPLVQSLGLELQRGNRIGVGPELTVPDHPEVYVVGDIAAITDAKTEQVLPQLGSVALQSGEHAGETIARRIAGKETEAVQVPRQGHDGDDRPRRGRRADARRADDDGQEGAGGLGRGAPRAAAHERGPRESGGRLGREHAHPPARGPHHRRKRVTA